METDIWGQLALEASQVYLENGNNDESKSVSSWKTVTSEIYCLIFLLNKKREIYFEETEENLSNDVIVTIADCQIFMWNFRSFFLFCFHCRPSISCQTKFYWTFSPIYLIGKYVEWQEFVDDGVKSLTTHVYGRMSRCDQKYPDCMSVRLICFCIWFMFASVHRCVTSNCQLNWSLTPSSMSSQQNVRILLTCCWISPLVTKALISTIEQKLIAPSLCSHAIARFQWNASVSNETSLHVHLSVGSYFHGRIHEKNLQFH